MRPYEHLRLPPLTNFTSFTKVTIQKAECIGFIRRINTCTYPNERESVDSRNAVVIFSEWHVFPVVLLRRGASAIANILGIKN